MKEIFNQEGYNLIGADIRFIKISNLSTGTT